MQQIKLFAFLLILISSINISQAETVNNPEEEIATTKKITTEAKDVVINFQNQLIETMKQGEKLGYSGRYKKLKSTVESSHYLTKIARIVVGKQWKNFSDAQKLQLTDVFSRLSISTYAHNFKSHSGESFTFVSEEETARGGKIIHSVLVLPEDKDVKFDYMLKKKGNSWRIINIIASGVSDLALKRSEYTSVLKREGFEALIAKISKKIDNYAK
jgi:phospholipid transport system substrate-binding protein